jgi:hypothetical protein
MDKGFFVLCLPQRFLLDLLFISRLQLKERNERESSVFPPPCARHELAEGVCHPTRRVMPRDADSGHDGVVDYKDAPLIRLSREHQAHKLTNGKNKLNTSLFANMAATKARHIPLF